MPKAFAREAGIEIRIGNYGTATHDRPAVVPQAVADELAKNSRVRVEADEPSPRPAPKKHETPALVAEKE